MPYRGIVLAHCVSGHAAVIGAPPSPFGLHRIVAARLVALTDQFDDRVAIQVLRLETSLGHRRLGAIACASETARPTSMTTSKITSAPINASILLPLARQLVTAK